MQTYDVVGIQLEGTVGQAESHGEGTSDIAARLLFNASMSDVCTGLWGCKGRLFTGFRN
jgi:hypothetical protein